MKLLLREKLILGFYFIIGLAERKINKNSAVEWDKYFLSMKESFLNRYFIVLYFISTVLSSCIAYVLFSVFAVKRYKAKGKQAIKDGLDKVQKSVVEEEMEKV